MPSQQQTCSFVGTAAALPWVFDYKRQFKLVNPDISRMVWLRLFLCLVSLRTGTIHTSYKVDLAHEEEPLLFIFIRQQSSAAAII